MSEASKAADYSLDPKSGWGGAYRYTAAVGVLGAIAAAIGAQQDLHRFAFSYLFAFIAILMIALGSIFFCLIQWLTSSGWSVTVRRTVEFMVWPIWVFAILFVPIYLNMGELYPWTATGHGDHAEAAEHAEVGDHGEAHAEADEHGEAHAEAGHADLEANPTIGDYDPQNHYSSIDEHAMHQAHEEILEKKVPYLNKGFFSIRMVIYFIAWALIGLLLWRYSTTQDVDGDPKWTVKMQRLAPVGIIVITFSSTFAAFDWIMSLEPSWFSTIFGVNFFADCIVSMFATTTLIAMSLRASGHFKNSVTVEHFHDLGKLLFGFLVFWAYVNFSQMMLIWYASIPEETTYYHQRWVGGWREVSMAIIFGHFIIPFFVIVSRNAKRALGVLRLGAIIILTFHFVMVYWLVMPYQNPGHFSPHWIDLACLTAVAGVYFTLVFFRMTKNQLVARNDPRLARAVHFINA